MYCKNCGATEFEVIGIPHGIVKFECKNWQNLRETKKMGLSH